MPIVALWRALRGHESPPAPPAKPDTEGPPLWARGYYPPDARWIRPSEPPERRP
jgi:hypothetical protein